MPNVRLLDTNTINKIAAGEVVERPASCVKELVENAIDAGATHIEVEILNGGKSLIRVTDDGCGMSREDVSLALRRHATSKLSNVNDLLNIATLGFRGEALPTIASVSKFTIQTRRADSETGTKIYVEGGKNPDTQETGCKIGTTVIVADLFFNTPARLKFLKATSTEAGKIHEYIVKLAFSRPNITFKFINNNKPAIATPGSGSLFDAVTSIHGTDLAEALIPVNLEVENLKISGFIGKPNFTKSYRTWQTFIVNGRVISNRTIAKAVEESYEALVPKGGYPFVVLNIDVPQNSIDVNVHPQKIELKFENDSWIFKVVHRAVREAITGGDAEHKLAEVAAPPVEPVLEPLNLNEIFGEPTKTEKKNFSVENIRESLKPAVDVPAEDFPIDDIFEVEESSATKIEEPPPKSPEPKPSPPPKIETPKKNFEPEDKLQPLGQIALCYIVAQGGANLYIVDQHAAHERILFDRLSAYADTIPAQGLLIHRVIKFGVQESLLIENNLELFSKLGLTMEPSGENEFRLVEVPLDAADADPEIILREIISSLPEVDTSLDANASDLAAKIRKSFLAVTACRAAIKAGQELNARQMQILLDDLARTPNPYTCPHGRPTILKFTGKDLAKMFKRT